MEKTLTILMVHCHYRLPGGEDAVFADDCAMLRAHGHTVIPYERTNTESTGDTAPAAQKLLLPFRAVYSFKTVREIRALIRRHHVDVVHVHNTLLVISPSVFAAARAEGVPVVQTLHNFRIFCPDGVLLREGEICEDCPNSSLLCAVKHRCYRGSLAQSIVCAAVYGFHRLLGTYRTVNLITLTNFNRDKLLAFNARHRVFDPARLYVRPNTVPFTPGEPPLPWSQRKNQVVYAGRLEELKGIRTLIEAWQLLRDDADAPRLLLCGTGPMEPWAREHAAGCKVEFLGQVPRQTLHQLLAESRAAVAPSLCYEGFALVPAEAHTLGTVVLASDLGNVGAMVRPGVDGILFAPGDAAALRDAVRALPAFGPKTDPAAIAAATRAAFGAEQGYQQLMTIYRTIINKGDSK